MNFPKLVGVIHLPALPGTWQVQGQHPADVLNAVGSYAIEEARVFSKMGFDGLILENFGDAPFFPDQVGVETVASMSIIAAAVRQAFRGALGINVLRNDAQSALAIASVTGCDFIRVNVLSGVAATDQGLVQGQAAALLRERARLSSQVHIFADVHVKHAVTLSSADLASSVEDTLIRGGADAVILTGTSTGSAVDAGDSLKQAFGVSRRVKKPLYLGSGITTKNLPDYKNQFDGIIVGSAIRKGGVAGAKLDTKKLKEFSSAFSSKKLKRKAISF